MINYYKYLPVSKEDEHWGLCVLNTGCTRVAAAAAYPVKDHPAQYYFNWNMGRILNEYQVIYISKGKGIFESDHCRQQEVKAGTIIILFPGERHRYRPLAETGWDEHWIGIKGPIMDKLVRESFFSPEAPCLYIGFHEATFHLFNYIIEHSQQENPGYQPLIAGAALHLMGNIHYILKQNTGGIREQDIIINKARLLFRANITSDFSPEQAADALQVGYSWFRKAFKSYTGLSPFQYYLQLKIERAKELLNDPNVPIKEIAYSLRFESSFYFSKIFREKTGFSPTGYRKRAQGEI